MKIHLYYNGKRSVKKCKKEIVVAKNPEKMIQKIKRRCKELDLTHVQAKLEIFGMFVAYSVYDTKPLLRLSKTDLETGHLVAYNIHRDREK